MAKPIILTVDDDATVSQAISRGLRSRYSGRYRIVRANSGAKALEAIEELCCRLTAVRFDAPGYVRPCGGGRDTVGAFNGHR